MSTAENAKLQYEAGQNSVAMVALTDSGDNTTFESAASLWSGRAGYAPVVRPNGVLTGGAITPHATDDTVTVAALTLNLQGVVTSVSAGTAVASRGATTDTHRITSITINSSAAITAVPGTDHTAFSDVRGDPGGPPLIPVDSVEIGQVRLTAIAADVVMSSEIFQVVGLHQERADFPLYDINYGTGSVTFLAALATDEHTRAVPKKVYASYASPIFAAGPRRTRASFRRPSKGSMHSLRG